MQRLIASYVEQNYAPPWTWYDKDNDFVSAKTAL